MFFSVTQFLSTAPDFIKRIFEIITILAETYTIIVVCAAVYWCGDRKAGQRLALTVASGLCINALVKNIFRVPRIFTISDQVDATRVQTATGYSFPSGHTQNASVLGGSFSYQLKKRRATVLFALYALLVGFSRLVLGVHYPTDVLGGLIIGFGWAYCSNRLFDRIEKSGKEGWFLLYLAPGLLSLLTLLRPGTDPSQLHDLIAGFCLTVGLVAGLFLERKYVRFSPVGSRMRKALRLIAGLAVVGVVMGVFTFFPHTIALSAVKYALVGLTASCGFPYCMKKFKL